MKTINYIYISWSWLKPLLNKTVTFNFYGIRANESKVQRRVAGFIYEMLNKWLANSDVLYGQGRFIPCYGAEGHCCV